MSAYSDYRAGIMPQLLGLLRRWREISAALQNLPAEKQAATAKLEVNASSDNDEWAQHKSRLSTYIRMASGGEADAPDGPGRTATKLDFAVLRQLSSCEPTLSNGHQPRLFDEACAQYRYVESQMRARDARGRMGVGEVEETFAARKRTLESQLQGIEEQYIRYFNSTPFIAFLRKLIQENNTFVTGTHITLGYGKVTMPVTAAAARYLAGKRPDIFDGQRGTMNISYGFDIRTGGVFNIEHDAASAEAAIEGIRNFATRAIEKGLTGQVCLFDPVHYNDRLLGPLSSLDGLKGSPVARVPTTESEITKSLSSLREEIVRWESDLKHNEPLFANRILILNQFPQEYSPEAVKCVRFLCVNARRNGLTIFILGSNSQAAHRAGSDGVMAQISETAKALTGQGGAFTITDGATLGFAWTPRPNISTQAMAARFEEKAGQVDFNNDYGARVGYMGGIPRKGNKKLVNIPYGIDKEGNIATLHFEDEFFGTFICGAAGAGKTTLIHTIINGLLCHHPDDIELWLIDFKKVEFGQYIKHRPPHVRYILLENSPEIIFDIVDELTRKLEKRKQLFKDNGWTKLSDVPTSRAMPVVFVIIDEFSEMSGVLAASAGLSGNGEDYREKFKLLFSEGRSFGFRFILSCQAFSEGTRGLAEFAKMQIQQRLVLKSQKSEIKGTLDLAGVSDEDQFLIENLGPHYALERMPLDTRGNRLRKVHVLYPANKNARFAWIDNMRMRMTPVRRYVPGDNTVYGDKMPVVIDGNTYTSFRHMAEGLRAFIEEEKRKMYVRQTLLFIGTPLRMKQIDAVRLGQDYRENVLLVSQPSNMMKTSSIIYSIAASAALQRIPCEMWGMEYDPLLNQAYRCKPQNLLLTAGAARATERLRAIYDAMERNELKERIIVIPGLDVLLRSTGESDSFAPPVGGYLGLPPRGGAAAPAAAAPSFDSMIKALLKKGPLYGCHIVAVFSNSEAFNQCRLPDAFRHKILFRTSAREANDLMIPAAQAACYQTLGENQYRYTNGLERNTYRPYFHPGLVWDNQTMEADGTIHAVSTSTGEDYLV